MLSPFAGLVSQAIATAADHERAAEPSDVMRALERVLPGIPVTWVRPVGEAVELAREWSGPGGAVLVTGSFYVAGEARAAFAVR